MIWYTIGVPILGNAARIIYSVVYDLIAAIRELLLQPLHRIGRYTNICSTIAICIVKLFHGSFVIQREMFHRAVFGNYHRITVQFSKQSDKYSCETGTVCVENIGFEFFADSV